MRIAVTAESMDPTNSRLAPSLGLAKHILILDEAGNVFDSIDLLTESQTGNASFWAGSALKEKEVDLLLTTQCDPQVEKDLKSSGIDVKYVRADYVREALDHYQRNELFPTSFELSESIIDPNTARDSQTLISATEASHIYRAVEKLFHLREAKIAKKNRNLARLLDKHVEAKGKLLARYEQFEKHQQPVSMALLLALVEFLVPKVQFRDYIGDILMDIDELEKDTQKVEARIGEARAKAEQAVAKAKQVEEKAELVRSIS